MGGCDYSVRDEKVSLTENALMKTGYTKKYTIRFNIFFFTYIVGTYVGT